MSNTGYKLTMVDVHSNTDVIIKRINNYYIKQITEERVVIIGNVQCLLIELIKIHFKVHHFFQNFPGEHMPSYPLISS